MVAVEAKQKFSSLAMILKMILMYCIQVNDAVDRLVG